MKNEKDITDKFAQDEYGGPWFTKDQQLEKHTAKSYQRKEKPYKTFSDDYALDWFGYSENKEPIYVNSSDDYKKVA